MPISNYIKVPKTREEVIEHFKGYDDKFCAEIMTELFLLYHDDMHKTVAEAYEDTLRAVLGKEPLYSKE